MPVTFSQITNNTAKVTIPIDADTITILYYPSKITEKTYAQLNSFTMAGDIAGGFDILNDLLVSLIQSWDLYEDDAQTVLYPITANRFAELPIFFRIQVLQSILGDFRPNMLAPQTLNLLL